MKRIISLLLSTICTVMMISTLAFAAETSLEDTGVTVVRLNRREYDTLYVKTDGGNLNVRSGAVQSMQSLENLPTELKLMDGVFSAELTVRDVPGQISQQKISTESQSQAGF